MVAYQGDPDWTRRPTWKQFCEVFNSIAMLKSGNIDKDKSAYVKLANLCQSGTAELHNRIYLESSSLCWQMNRLLCRSVVDFRTIEIYIETLARKNASKMKLGRDQSVWALVLLVQEASRQSSADLNKD